VGDESGRICLFVCLFVFLQYIVDEEKSCVKLNERSVVLGQKEIGREGQRERN
jgi:hypothetical protein